MQSGAENAVSIALIASGDPEQTQARWWRQVADQWPHYAPSPLVQRVLLSEAADGSAPLSVSAVFLIVSHLDDQSQVFQVLDRLERESLPSVALFEHYDDGCRELIRNGAIAMPLDTSGSAIATTLSALAMRQETVESLKRELRLSRRFQGGICGEMEKLNEELQLAASVQKEFLPKTLPQVPNVDFRVLFRPCGYVSGDIYDVQRLDEHHIGFFLADAVGHGVPAALMTMVLSRSLTMKTVMGDSYSLLSPSEVLRRLNAEMIHRHGDAPRFATAVYGLMDCRDRTVTLAGAGHPPPLRFSSRGMEKVETPGGLLGVFPNDSFDEVKFTLESDEMLVLYSDGLETAFPAPNADARGRKLPTQHYLDHFTDMARAWTSEDVTASMRLLANRLDQQMGSLHQVDDVTVMAVVPRTERSLDRMFRGADSQERGPEDTKHETRDRQATTA